MDKDTALDMALEALEMVVVDVKTTPTAYETHRQAIAAIKQARSAPVQELWGFHIQFNNGKDATFKGFEHLAGCEAHLESGETITMIYTTQPAARRQWVGLTDEEISAIGSKIFPSTWNTRHVEFARAIEAKLKAKNTV
jgi:hypothetical protein